MIELEPFGLTQGMERGRPVMLFREKGGDQTLPVWLSPLDAGIALGQRSGRIFATSPHDVSLKILDQMGVKIKSCCFSEIKGHQQFVELTFSGSRKLKTATFRADHAVSFCLQARARFYCAPEYIEQCREIDASLDRTQFSLNSRATARRHGTRYLN